MPNIMTFKERKKVAIEVLREPVNNSFFVITEAVKKHMWNLEKGEKTKYWLETYPHIIIASAIVDENNVLYEWKVGERSYDDYFIHEGYSVKLKMWTVNNNVEHEKVFNSLSKQWFKNFKIAENFKGCMPY